MSAPQLGPGAQAMYAALRGRRDESASVIDGAAHDRLDALEGRVSRLEAARDEDEQDGAA